MKRHFPFLIFCHQFICPRAREKIAKYEKLRIFVIALRDLVPFVQFKKCEKHPWRTVAFSKVAGF